MSEDALECPHCGEEIGDLWEYDWSDDEEIETECGHCDKPIVIHQIVTVTYEIEKKDGAA